MTTIEAAALWWAERFLLDDKREEFCRAVLRHLYRAGAVDIHVEYANDSVLCSAVWDVCEGDAPEDVSGLFSPHIAMQWWDGLVWVKDGKDTEWEVLRW